MPSITTVAAAAATTFASAPSAALAPTTATAANTATITVNREIATSGSASVRPRQSGRALYGARTVCHSVWCSIVAAGEGCAACAAGAVGAGAAWVSPPLHELLAQSTAMGDWRICKQMLMGQFGLQRHASMVRQRLACARS